MTQRDSRLIALLFKDSLGITDICKSYEADVNNYIEDVKNRSLIDLFHNPNVGQENIKFRNLKVFSSREKEYPGKDVWIDSGDVYLAFDMNDSYESRSEDQIWINFTRKKYHLDNGIIVIGDHRESDVTEGNSFISLQNVLININKDKQLSDEYLKQFNKLCKDGYVASYVALNTAKVVKKELSLKLARAENPTNSFGRYIEVKPQISNQI